MDKNVEWPSYQEWCENAASLETLAVNRSITRDIFIFPDGTKVYDNYVIPFNIFLSAYNFTVVDLILPINAGTEEMLKKYGAEFTDMYNEEGFGYPMFVGDGDTCEAAYAFVRNEKKSLLLLY
jgi:hypothetical protein